MLKLQSDIVPVLKGFNFKVNEEKELFIMNPPVLKVDEEEEYPAGSYE